MYVCMCFIFINISIYRLPTYADCIQNSKSKLKQLIQRTFSLCAYAEGNPLSYVVNAGKTQIHPS